MTKYVLLLSCSIFLLNIFGCSSRPETIEECNKLREKERSELINDLRAIAESSSSSDHRYYINRVAESFEKKDLQIYSSVLRVDIGRELRSLLGKYKDKNDAIDEYYDKQIERIKAEGGK